MDAVAAAIAALRAGEPVVLPTDTVYGLCADARDEAAVERLYALKGRVSGQPTAVLAASVDALLELLPELRADERVLRALLPGPYTLVLPNPARRLPWLAGGNPDAIGVRAVDLPGRAPEVLAAVGAVAATSANVPGGPDPATVDDVQDAIRSGCGAVVDAGPVGGVASTVIDLTGPVPVVLREGAVPAAEALARLHRPQG